MNKHSTRKYKLHVCNRLWSFELTHCAIYRQIPIFWPPCLWLKCVVRNQLIYMDRLQEKWSQRLMAEGEEVEPDMGQKEC
jgi:hypothetical protein